MMDQSPLELALLRRSKWLIHALLVSVMINISLIATFSYFALSEKKQSSTSSETSKSALKSYAKIKQANSDVLHRLMSYSFQQLTRELENEEHIEEGQRMCDLALAVLVRDHYFDLNRALSGCPIEQRTILLDDQEMILFSGLSKDCLQAVRNFSRQELWPLTPEGLYRQIQTCSDGIPLSLIETFYLTSEFDTIERAFNRLPFFLSREALLQLLLDAGWDELLGVYSDILGESRGKMTHFAPFLTSLVSKDSKLAAYLLVGVDRKHAIKSLSDEDLEKLIGLLNEPTDEVKLFFEELASSLRADAFREKAEGWLKKSGGRSVEAPAKTRGGAYQTYLIQEGDSLWKISRRFKVPIVDIKRLNKIDSDVLTPGKELLIPTQ